MGYGAAAAAESKFGYIIELPGNRAASISFQHSLASSEAKANQDDTKTQGLWQSP